MSEDAEDAFAAVADELRVRILRELWDADDPLAFSELRDRVDVRDSGRFNYHLGELRGRFVERGEDGYALRFAGRKLVGALYSGVYTEDVGRIGPQPVEGSCVNCGSALEAVYEDEHGKIDCTDCEVTVVMSGIPPAFVEGREDDLAAAIDGYVRTTQRSFLDGFCSACSGPTTGRLTEGEFGPRAVLTCERCGSKFHGLAGWVAMDHAATVAFYHDHDRDLHDIPTWELGWLDAAEWDGDRALLTVELAGDELRLTVDDSLAVVDAHRG
jgi:DNA-directed RNA polymerase subunit RPC12/RpoP